MWGDVCAESHIQQRTTLPQPPRSPETLLLSTELHILCYQSETSYRFQSPAAVQHKAKSIKGMIDTVSSTPQHRIPTLARKSGIQASFNTNNIEQGRPYLRHALTLPKRSPSREDPVQTPSHLSIYMHKLLQFTSFHLPFNAVQYAKVIHPRSFTTFVVN